MGPGTIEVLRGGLVRDDNPGVTRPRAVFERLNTSAVSWLVDDNGSYRRKRGKFDSYVRQLTAL